MLCIYMELFIYNNYITGDIFHFLKVCFKSNPIFRYP